MNERIQQLAAKHALYVDGGYGKTNYTFTKESLKEFAESIVKECCQKLEDDGMVEIAIEMKQHFGVE